MKKEIRLVALDMDGTLFNRQSQITAANQDAIRTIAAKGVEVAISTGRPYAGLPAERLAGLGIRYAITANGAAIYHLPDKKLLFETCMDADFLCPLLAGLQKKDIHIDAFIDGSCYCLASCKARIDCLAMPESIRHYIKTTRTFVDDLAAFIRERRLAVQKITLNFYPLPDGTYAHREEIKALLSCSPGITFLSGGYHNLEFTRAGTSKGTGLRFLCAHLGIPLTQTMAVGDSGNDLDILQTAAIGVAMGNARNSVKETADFVTLSNEEDGVAYAIRHLIN